MLLTVLQGDIAAGTCLAILGELDGKHQYWLLETTVASEASDGEVLGVWLHADDPSSPLTFTTWSTDEVRIWRRCILADVSSDVERVDNTWTLRLSAHKLLCYGASEEAKFFPRLRPQQLDFSEPPTDQEHMLRLNLDVLNPWRTKV